MAGDHESIDPIEVDALIDYALLKYLERNNRLPANAPEVLKKETSLRDKKKIALIWAQRN
jgi:hypothetical protein